MATQAWPGQLSPAERHNCVLRRHNTHMPITCMTHTIVDTAHHAHVHMYTATHSKHTTYHVYCAAHRHSCTHGARHTYRAHQTHHIHSTYCTLFTQALSTHHSRRVELVQNGFLLGKTPQLHPPHTLSQDTHRLPHCFINVHKVGASPTAEMTLPVWGWCWESLPRDPHSWASLQFDFLGYPLRS